MESDDATVNETVMASRYKLQVTKYIQWPRLASTMISKAFNYSQALLMDYIQDWVQLMLEAIGFSREIRGVNRTREKQR